ncbi:hypothetical protein LXL04_039574 [Taraxacum kok-saghyz]
MIRTPSFWRLLTYLLMFVEMPLTILQKLHLRSVLDVVVSLAKVADVDRNLDAEDSATEGFQEAIKLFECLKINTEENALEQRVLDVVVYLAKVADVDRNLDAEDSATEGFQEAIKLFECLKINSEENALEQRTTTMNIKAPQQTKQQGQRQANSKGRGKNDQEPQQQHAKELQNTTNRGRGIFVQKQQ